MRVRSKLARMPRLGFAATGWKNLGVRRGKDGNERGLYWVWMDRSTWSVFH